MGIYMDPGRERHMLEARSIDDIRAYVHTEDISLLLRGEIYMTWNTYLKEKYESAETEEQKYDILADFWALHRICILPEREFFMKCADRLHNIADTRGLVGTID